MVRHQDEQHPRFGLHRQHPWVRSTHAPSSLQQQPPTDFGSLLLNLLDGLAANFVAQRLSKFLLATARSTHNRSPFSDTVTCGNEDDATPSSISPIHTKEVHATVVAEVTEMASENTVPVSQTAIPSSNFAIDKAVSPGISVGSRSFGVGNTNIDRTDPSNFAEPMSLVPAETHTMPITPTSNEHGVSRRGSLIPTNTDPQSNPSPEAGRGSEATDVADNFDLSLGERVLPYASVASDEALSCTVSPLPSLVDRPRSLSQTSERHSTHSDSIDQNSSGIFCLKNEDVTLAGEGCLVDTSCTNGRSSPPDCAGISMLPLDTNTNTEGASGCCNAGSEDEEDCDPGSCHAVDRSVCARWVVDTITDTTYHKNSTVAFRECSQPPAPFEKNPTSISDVDCVVVSRGGFDGHQRAPSHCSVNSAMSSTASTATLASSLHACDRDLGRVSGEPAAAGKFVLSTNQSAVPSLVQLLSDELSTSEQGTSNIVECAASDLRNSPPGDQDKSSSSSVAGYIDDDSDSLKQLASHIVSQNSPETTGNTAEPQRRGVPASPAGPADEATAGTEAQEDRPVTVIRMSQALYLALILQEMEKKKEVAAKDRPDQQPAANTHEVDACISGLSRDGKKGGCVRAYRPDLHTIAALVVEERNMTGRSELSSDSSSPRVTGEERDAASTDVIDTSFISRTVQQHEASLKRRKKANEQRSSSHSGKRAKKLKKKTGRMNKERRLLAEKALQSTNDIFLPGDVNTPLVLKPSQQSGRVDFEGPADMSHTGREGTTVDNNLKKKRKSNSRRGRSRRDVKLEQRMERNGILLDHKPDGELVATVSRNIESDGAVTVAEPVHGEPTESLTMCVVEKEGITTSQSVASDSTVAASDLLGKSAFNNPEKTIVVPKGRRTSVTTIAFIPKNQLYGDSGIVPPHHDIGRLASAAKSGGTTETNLAPLAADINLAVAPAAVTGESKSVVDGAVFTAKDAAIEENAGVMKQSLNSNLRENDPPEKQLSATASPGRDIVASTQKDEFSAPSTINVAKVECSDSSVTTTSVSVHPLGDHVPKKAQDMAAQPIPNELASPSTAVVTSSTSRDFEAHVRSLLSRSTQPQQQHQQPRACELTNNQATNNSFAPPPYNISGPPWPPYPEPIPYCPMNPAGSLYPFPDQLPEYFPPPYYNYHEPYYTGFVQQQHQQHYEPCYERGYRFNGQESRFTHEASAMAYCTPIPGKPKDVLEMGGTTAPPLSAPTQKPWYLQPLAYEEDKEREFEARGPSHRMRLMKVCRKYGL